MNGLPIYNSRIAKNYIEFLQHHYPEINIATILEHAEIASYQLGDEGHWFTQQQIDRFHEIISHLTGNPNISRDAGRYSISSKAIGVIKQYLLGFVSPAAVYNLVEKVAINVNRGHKWRTRSLGTRQIEVMVTTNPGVHEQIFQCENRIGTLEAVAKMFTGKYAKIEHTSCIHNGGGQCTYRISWEETPSFIWKRVRNYTALIGLPVCIALSFIISPHLAISISSLFLSLLLGISYYAEYTDKKKLAENLASQGDAASLLLAQINTSYNNALLVQEIGQATASVLDIDLLLSFVVDALEKRLDYDRGMIMLANREKTRLIYTIGFGYNPGQREYLESVEFNLDKPDSRGTFVISFKKQIPLLINDLSEIEGDLSQRSIEFAKRMGTHSFVCVPIVFKKESLGILIVDNIQSKRLLSQSDMNLLMGIAPQIAISINNARTYEKLQEREKRFRTLAESAPDIIFTLDREGMLTYVNPMLEKILGYKQEEVMGKYFSEFVQEQDSNQIIPLFKRIRDHKETQMDVLLTFTSRSGIERNFSLNCAPYIATDGHVDSLVGILKDVTDLRRSEVKLKKSYEKLEMALSSTVSVISLIVDHSWLLSGTR